MPGARPHRPILPAAVTATAAGIAASMLLAVLLVGARPAAAQGARGEAGGAVIGDHVIYVDADTAPGGDGASWATAFRDLQDALAVAEADDEVWVAEGVYKPTTGSDRTATFALASGVALYGGFDGTETHRDQRDWTIHESILSGDIGGTFLTNAYHVVTASGTDSTAILDGVVVEDGSAYPDNPPNNRGGALYAVEGSPTIRNCLFRGNVAYRYGGAVYVEGGNPLIEDAVFEDNTANFGGALYASASSPALRRVVFRRNDWGGVRFADGSTGVVEDTLFEQNTGPAAGIDASSPVFRRTTFRDNVYPTDGSIVDGAGARIAEGAPRFEDCLFEDLRTRHDLGGGSGGSVYVPWRGEPARPVFVRTTFRGSTASQGGGGRLEPSDALFLFCRFEHNRARIGGGLAGYETAVTVIGSTFVGNRAEAGASSGYGGGLDLAYAPLLGGRSLVASTLFAGNHAGRGGGAVALGSSGTLPADLVNVTFAGNEAGEEGGAVYFSNAAGVRLHNAVLWGNAAPTGAEVYVESGAGPTVERAIIAGGCPAGATCTAVLDEDPLFVREPSPGPDGTWGTADDDYGDLRLQTTSPALDAGLAALLPEDRWDLDADGDTTEVLPIDAVGGRRVWGPEVDLGAYERGPAARSPRRAPLAAASEAAELSVEVRPNPMRGVGEVVLVLPEAGEVEAAVYDVLGRRVAVLASGELAAGRHEFALDAGRLPAGVYVVRVSVGGVVQTQRLTLVR